MGRWDDRQVWKRERIIPKKYGTKTHGKNQEWLRKNAKFPKSANGRKKIEGIRWESQYRYTS